MNLEPEVDEGDVTLVNVRKENGILKECQEKTGKWAWRSKDGELTMLRGDVRFENVGDRGFSGSGRSDKSNLKMLILVIRKSI